MSDFSVSIIVACHNEASTLGRKLDNCLAMASKDSVEVLVVDDHSTDGTMAHASEHLGRNHPIPLGWTVRFLKNRYTPGKNGALQTAFDEARGSILLVTDADIILNEDILERACERFGADPKLGALCLSPRIGSMNAVTVARYTVGYEAFNRWLKTIQSRLDSLPILHGQAMFLRASLKITPHLDLPADDVDFAFQVRLQGSRTCYAPDLYFYEEISPQERRVFWQKVRRAKAVMRSFWRYRRILLNPRYGLFGLVCFPVDFFFYFTLAPVTLVMGLGITIWFLVNHGAVGAGIVMGVLLLMLAPPFRSVALYLVILMVSQVTLILERHPRIRWKTQRILHG